MTIRNRLFYPVAASSSSLSRLFGRHSAALEVHARHQRRRGKNRGLCVETLEQRTVMDGTGIPPNPTGLLDSVFAPPPPPPPGFVTTLPTGTPLPVPDAVNPPASVPPIGSVFAPPPPPPPGVVVAPPIQPPASTPPASTPPASTPPASTPPASTPPGGAVHGNNTKPTNVEGQPLDGAVTLTWTAPNGNDLPEIVGYNIQFSSNNGNTWSEYYSSSLSSSCTAVIPNLINGDAYIFRVQARFGGFGLPGDWSDASSEVIPEAGGDNVGGESSGWPSWVPPWIVDKFESWTHTKPLWDVVDKVKDAGEQRGDMLDQLARGEPVDLQEINDVVFSALGEAGQAAHDTVIDIYDSVLPGFKWGHEIADTLSNVDFTVSGFVSDVWDYIDIVLGDEKTSTTDAVIDLLQNDGNINETSTGTKIQMIEIFIEGWKAWR